MPWPASHHVSTVGDGLLCADSIYLSSARIMHLHMHTMVSDSRLGVQAHGVWQVPTTQVSRYGNLNYFFVNLARYALSLVQARDTERHRATLNGSRLTIVCRVLDSNEGGFGYVNQPTLTGMGNHAVFGLQHALIVMDRDAGNQNVWNLVTAYPVNASF